MSKLKALPLFFVGSLPFVEPGQAIDFVKRASLSLPFLPQLPAASEKEEMIGQVLRGFELGYWDEEASGCLPYFLEGFLNAFRVKVQIAGPFTVASAISAQFEEIAPAWLALATNIVDQFRKAGLRAEIWLQIDEPVFSRVRHLPKAYHQFVKLAGAIDRSTVLGLHACAPERPEVPIHIRRHLKFLSLNFSRHSMTAEEAAEYAKAGAFGQNFIAGILPKPGEPIAEVGGDFPWNGDKVWVSPPCGLQDWTVDQVERLATRT